MAEFALAVGALQLGNHGIDLAHGTWSFVNRARRAHLSIEQHIDEVSAIIHQAQMIERGDAIPEHIKSRIDEWIKSGESTRSKLQHLSLQPGDTTFSQIKKRLSFARKQRDFGGDVQSFRNCVSTVHSTTMHGSGSRNASHTPFRDLANIARNRNFVGQKHQLSTLANASSWARRTVLVGLGGTGKSEIAIQFVFNFRESHDEASIVWLDGSNEAILEEGLRKVGLQAPHLAGLDPRDINLLDVKEWLDRKQLGRWLIVVDNARFDALLGQRNLLACLPDRDGVHVVFTTRSHYLATQIASQRATIEILGMNYLDSRRLLLDSGLPRSNESEADIKDLLLELKCRPGPILQAAAYMVMHTMGVFDYLSLWRSSHNTACKLYVDGFREDFLARSDSVPKLIPCVVLEDFQSHGPGLYRVLVAAASISQACEIPAELLYYLAGRFGIPDAPVLLQNDGILTFQKSDNNFTIDFFARAIITSQMEGTQELQVLFSAKLNSIASTFPAHEQQASALETCRRFSRHAQAILDLALLRFADVRDPDSDICVMALLASALCHFYTRLALYEKATRLLDDVRPLLETNAVPDQVVVSSLLSAEANLQLHMGDFAMAENTTYLVFTMRSRHVGIDHIETAHSLHNMGVAYDKQDKLRDAEVCYRKALRIKTRVVGDSHGEVWISEVCLALLFVKQRKHLKAERRLRKVCNAYQNARRPAKVETCDAFSNLGVCLQNQGRYPEAEKYHRLALTGRRGTLGNCHPETLKSQANIALALHYQGHLSEADKILREVSMGFHKALGPMHEETLKTLRNRAILLRKQQKLFEAEMVIREMLTALETHHGRLHQKTWDSLTLLILLLQYQEKFELALEAARLLCGAKVDQLGAEHECTRKSLDHAKRLNRQTWRQWFGRVSLGAGRLLGACVFAIVLTYFIGQAWVVAT